MRSSKSCQRVRTAAITARRAQLAAAVLTLLTDEEVARLHEATLSVLSEWIARLREETGPRFPEKVTAFRPGMAVHGRFGEPCPVCKSPVQRIVHAENESNYCPTCQTGGKLLADRALSRLLKGDWPRTLEELEERKKIRAKAVLARIDTSPGRLRAPSASLLLP
jgi:formamidopyrimidine-DNA glycosylase